MKTNINNTINPIVAIALQAVGHDRAGVTPTEVGGNKLCAKPGLFATILAVLVRLFSPASKTTKPGGIKSVTRTNFDATPDAVFSCHAHPRPVEMYFVRNAKTRQGYRVKIFSCPDCAKEYVIGRNFTTGTPMVLTSRLGTPAQKNNNNPQDWSPGQPRATAIDFNATAHRTAARQRGPLRYARAAAAAVLLGL